MLQRACELSILPLQAYKQKLAAGFAFSRRFTNHRIAPVCLEFGLIRNSIKF